MNNQIKKLLKNLSYMLIAVIVLIGFVCVGIYMRTQFLKNSENNVSPADIAQLQNKITHLENLVQKQIQKPSPINSKDISALNEKLLTMEKANLEILESKASLSSVMGIVERIDSLESQIKILNAGTSQSALILTAAALVENAAKKRTPFMYEASVLEELSRGTPMEKSAQIIAGLSIKGLPTKEELIERFIRLYEVNFIESRPKIENPRPVHIVPVGLQDWKQKLIHKLKSLLIIEKISDDEQLIAYENNDTSTDDVYRLVRNGDFETALLKMSTEPKYQTEAFQIWAEDVVSEKIFDKQMSKIKALTLSAIKMESLQ